jgi:hypothetical protein
MKVTTRMTLAAKARQLGQEHAAAGITPFGDAAHVYWDGGSADLMTALGEPVPGTEENRPEREAALAAYCGVLGPFRPLPEPAQLELEIFAEECALRGLPPLPEPSGDGAR